MKLLMSLPGNQDTAYQLLLYWLTLLQLRVNMSLLCHSLRRLLVVLVMQFRSPCRNFAAVEFIAPVKVGRIHKDKILGIQW
jgi:hypothetical protein